jgi:hypothetical protein
MHGAPRRRGGTHRRLRRSAQVSSWFDRRTRFASPRSHRMNGVKPRDARRARWKALRIHRGVPSHSSGPPSHASVEPGLELDAATKRFWRTTCSLEVARPSSVRPTCGLRQPTRSSSVPTNSSVGRAFRAETTNSRVEAPEANVGSTNSSVGSTDSRLAPTDAVVGRLRAWFGITDPFVETTDAFVETTDAFVETTDEFVGTTDAVVETTDSLAMATEASVGTPVFPRPVRTRPSPWSQSPKRDVQSAKPGAVEDRLTGERGAWPWTCVSPLHDRSRNVPHRRL